MGMRAERDYLLVLLTDPRWTVHGDERADGVRLLGDLAQPVLVLEHVGAVPTIEAMCGDAHSRTMWRARCLASTADGAYWLAERVQSLITGAVPDGPVIGIEWERTGALESDVPDYVRGLIVEFVTVSVVPV